MVAEDARASRHGVNFDDARDFADAALFEGELDAEPGSVPTEARQSPLVAFAVRAGKFPAVPAPGGPRAEALRRSFLGTKVLLGGTGGAFISLLDPHQWAAAAAATFRSVRTYPVLAGPPERHDLVLSA